jgi:CHAT domain-containing protein/Tfp pilus assembly protein PilF
VLAAAAFLATAQAAEPVRSLKLRKTIQSTLTPGETRFYSFKLRTGRYARIVLMLPNLATAIRLRARKQADPLVELNLPAGAQRPEPLCWIAGASGEYILELSAAASAFASPDKYEVELAEARRATPQDEKRVEAQRLFEDARRSSARQDFRHAVDVLEQALRLVRQAGDRERESATLASLGLVSESRSLAEEAVSYYEQSLVIAQEIGDRRGEELDLNHIGIGYRNLGRYDTAVTYHHRALAIAREIKDRRGEATGLNSLGSIHYFLGEYTLAIESYEQALVVARELKERRLEAVILSNLGNPYQYEGQYEKAADCYQQALVIRREAKDRQGEGTTLNNLGNVVRRMGQYETAIRYYEQALAIARETKDRRGEGLALGNMGIAYRRLSQFRKAIEDYEVALTIWREIKDRQGEALALNNLGNAYDDLGEHERAVEYHEQALAIFRAVKDRRGEADALGDLGGVYHVVGQIEKAISYYEQSLRLAREIKDRDGEGISLSNLGKAHTELRRFEAASEDLQQALAVLHEVKDRPGEIATLDGLMVAAAGAGRLALGVFYGKQAVNTTQTLRSDIRGLSPDLQRGFLKGNEKPYHTLAELLIAQGRLAEAEQVLALLKEEEYFEYIRRDGDEASSLNRRADLTAEETEWQKRYDEIGGQLMAIGSERGALLAKKTLTPEETQRLTMLDSDISVGNQKFQQFLGELAQHFSAKVDANRRIEDLRETQGIMEDLRELPEGTVAIYTLAAQDRFYAILRTADAQKVYEYPITAADLNRKIADFRQAVEDPRVDPRLLSEELYKIVVGGMAEDLRQAKAKTLMWSLDGALRYVPLAALYDGKQYLIEQYRIAVMTLASSTRLKDRPDSEWKAAGLGVTKAYDGSPALPFVSSELKSIISTRPGDAGVMKGEIKLDGDFTRDAMRQELLKRFPVVHIASHFRFQAGDDTKSFLLLGDGGHFSLAELKTSANLFGGVQLLTLSACNTGVGDGTEVEGFGTLAQRQGAKAVIASLWAVTDESTSRLMQEFYRIRESSPEMTKLEALRESQLELLHGAGQFSGESIRGVALHSDAKPDAPAFTSDPKAPFAHPYYWAPFFLMGNWL